MIVSRFLSVGCVCIGIVAIISLITFAEEPTAPPTATPGKDAADALNEMAAEVRESRADLRKQTDLADVSAEALRHTIGWLEEQRETLELDEVGMSARRAALTEAIEETSKKAEISVEKDPVVTEMKLAVEGRQLALARVEQLYKSGAAPVAEVDAAKRQLSEARVALLTRQHDAAAGAGGDVLAAWNRELVTLTIGEKERHARLEHVRKKLDQLRGVMDQVDRLQQKESLLRQLEQESFAGQVHSPTGRAVTEPASDAKP